jgi:hypothetical protein
MAHFSCTLATLARHLDRSTILTALILSNSAYVDISAVNIEQ